MSVKRIIILDENCKPICEVGFEGDMNPVTTQTLSGVIHIARVELQSLSNEELKAIETADDRIEIEKVRGHYIVIIGSLREEYSWLHEKIKKWLEKNEFDCEKFKKDIFNYVKTYKPDSITEFAKQMWG